jgi:TRAP-type C4-dicarboxylate transport system substrate-binding protein
MKKIVFSLFIVLILVILAVAGCNQSAEVPGEETSTCVICHSDKDMLKQTASVVEEKVSEETSGEG